MGKLYKHDEKTDKEFANLYRLVGSGTGGTGKDGKDGRNGVDGANGSDGVSAYVYIAYASDNIGTGFSLMSDPALNYMAVKSTDTFIASPSASDFTGFWKRIKGDDGQGVPAGGITGQVLTKKSGSDYDTEWATITISSGSTMGYFRDLLVHSGFDYLESISSSFMAIMGFVTNNFSVV